MNGNGVGSGDSSRTSVPKIMASNPPPSVHAPQNIKATRLRNPVGKKAQKSNPKVTSCLTHFSILSYTPYYRFHGRQCICNDQDSRPLSTYCGRWVGSFGCLFMLLSFTYWQLLYGMCVAIRIRELYIKFRRRSSNIGITTLWWILKLLYFATYYQIMTNSDLCFAFIDVYHIYSILMTYMLIFYHWIFEINEILAIFVYAFRVRVIRTAVAFNLCYHWQQKLATVTEL